MKCNRAKSHAKGTQFLHITNSDMSNGTERQGIFHKISNTLRTVAIAISKLSESEIRYRPKYTVCFKELSEAGFRRYPKTDLIIFQGTGFELKTSLCYQLSENYR